MKHALKILGFVGSLRKGSYNKALMRAAVELVPDDATIEVFDLAGIPPFNQDLENEPPSAVRKFKEKIRKADALLIASPLTGRLDRTATTLLKVNLLQS